MTEEQFKKGKGLLAEISVIKENIEQLANHHTFVSFHIDFCAEDATGDATRVRLGTYGAEPEIAEKIKQVLIDYYTEKNTRLENEFANL